MNHRSIEEFNKTNFNNNDTDTPINTFISSTITTTIINNNNTTDELLLTNNPLIEEFKIGKEILNFNNIDHNNNEINKNETNKNTLQTLQESFWKIRKAKGVTSLSKNVYQLLHLFSFENILKIQKDLFLENKLLLIEHYNEHYNNDNLNDKIKNNKYYLNWDNEWFKICEKLKNFEDGSNEYFYYGTSFIQSLSFCLDFNYFSYNFTLQNDLQNNLQTDNLNNEINNEINNLQNNLQNDKKIKNLDLERNQMINYLNTEFNKEFNLEIKDYNKIKFTKEIFFEMYKEDYCNFLLISYPSNQVLKILEMSLNEHFNNNNSLIAFSLLIPLLERGLQDVLYIYYLNLLQSITTTNTTNENFTTNENITTENTKINKIIELKNKIKEFEENENLPKFSKLLTMTELKEIFGNDKMELLRCFVGPLNSINLRNVILHGFIKEEEFQNCFTSLLFLIIPSLVCDLFNFLENKTIFGIEKCRGKRGIVDITKTLAYKSMIQLKNENDQIIIMTSDNKEEDNNNDKEMDKLFKEIDKLLEHSIFVIYDFISLYKQAFLDYFIHKNYLKCISILFPLLEHGIRRIFVCVNQCEDRLLTAEKNSLYTTLDILLSTRSIPSYKIEKNEIFNEIDNCIINVMFDLLIWTESLRIRDLISHGNLNIENIPKFVVDEIIALTFTIISKYDIRKVIKDYNDDYNGIINGIINGNGQDQEQHSVITKAVHYITNEYQSPFHPYSITDRQLYQTINYLYHSNNQNNIDKLIFELEQQNDYYNQVINETLQTDNNMMKLIEISKICNNELLNIIKNVENHFGINQDTIRSKVINVFELYPVTFTEKNVRKVNLIKVLASYAESIVQKMSSVVNECYQLCMKQNNNSKNKKPLKSKERIQITTMKYFYQTFYNYSILITCIAYCSYYHSLDMEDTFIVRTCEKIFGGTTASIKSNKFIRAIELIILQVPSKSNELKEIDYSFVGVSKGELERFKFDLIHLLNNP